MLFLASYHHWHSTTTTRWRGMTKWQQRIYGIICMFFYISFITFYWWIGRDAGRRGRRERALAGMFLFEFLFIYIVLPQYQQPHASHENRSFSTAAPFFGGTPVFQAMNMKMGKDGQMMGGVSFFYNIICYIFLLTNLEYYCHSTNDVTTTTTDTLPLQPQPLRRPTTSK